MYYKVGTPLITGMLYSLACLDDPFGIQSACFFARAYLRVDWGRDIELSEINRSIAYLAFSSFLYRILLTVTWSIKCASFGRMITYWVSRLFRYLAPALTIFTTVETSG